jgi:hypothetical protein
MKEGTASARVRSAQPQPVGVEWESATMVGAVGSVSTPRAKSSKATMGDVGHMGCPAEPSWSVVRMRSAKAARVRWEMMRG